MHNINSLPRTPRSQLGKIKLQNNLIYIACCCFLSPFRASCGAAKGEEGGNQPRVLLFWDDTIILMIPIEQKRKRYV